MPNESTPNTAKPNYTRYIVIGLVVVLGLGILYLLFGSGRTTAGPATITGEVDFNGITPTDASDPEKGEIVLMARPHDDPGEFFDTGVTIPFQDQAPWNWQTADSGQSYELKADVYYQGLLIQESAIVVATAPASGIILRTHVTLADIPEELIDNDNIDTETELTTVSGVISINGYIPSGSYVNFFARPADTEDEFVLVESIGDLPAANGAIFETDQAVYGEHYEYQAEMYTQDGTFIGQSKYLTVTAPATNENVVINSTASAPVQQATISGTITLHGPVEQGSSVLLLQRETGTSDFTEIDRFPASRQVNFSWKQASAGSTYDITAALQVNEQNTASGNVVTAAAPAKNLDIDIDTNFNLPAPNQAPSVSCGDADGTNNFNAEVSVRNIEGAKTYHLEVGTSAGSHNVLNETLRDTRTARIYIPADSPHFARFAYSACDDCQHDDGSNWSGWSPTLGFQCPEK